MARPWNFPTLNRGQNRAALFLDMGAPGELTLIEIRRKFAERILQVLAQNEIHLLGIKGRKSRRVGQKAIHKGYQFNMPRRMTAPPNPIRDRTGLREKVRLQAIQ